MEDSKTINDKARIQEMYRNTNMQLKNLWYAPMIVLTIGCFLTVVFNIYFLEGARGHKNSYIYIGYGIILGILGSVGGISILCFQSNKQNLLKIENGKLFDLNSNLPTLPSSHPSRPPSIIEIDKY